MSVRALITGVNGQDGVFLSKLLADKNMEVFGMSYQQHPSTNLDKRVRYVVCGIRESENIVDFCRSHEIDHFYNLAGISSLTKSFEEPFKT